MMGIRKAENSIDRVASKSASFYWPLRLFPREQAEAIARLYGFCRVADDWADDLTVDAGRVRIGQAIADIERGESEQPELRDLLQLSEEWSVPLRPAIHLLEALYEDAGGRRIADEGELIRFAYGVAGVVGLLLNPILGVKDRRADAHAIDLGIAMQLSNIARDVVEDAAIERVYLPQAWFGAPVEPAAIREAEDPLRAEVCAVVRRLLRLAEAYYASAEAGYLFIPWRSRLPIRMAGGFYREIGRTVGKAPERIWMGKVKPGRRGLGKVACCQLMRRSRAYRPHDSKLHAPLAGFV